MITLRPANERGHAYFGWLDSYHTFSFGNYYDPNHMGFRALRVINEDRVQPGEGFGTHPHRDMEIVTYVLSGELSHKDSMGNVATIHPNEVQRMTAGTGITHSEFNASATKPVHLLQIWLLPETNGLTPSYEEAIFPTETRQGQWRLLASRQGGEGSVKIHQDVDLYATLLDAGEQRSFSLRPTRHAWIQVTQGKLSLNDMSMEAGDGAAISNETLLEIKAHADAEILLFDLA
ncbi:MAG: pirin family protein [Leptolyngbyaceae cyanobacterium CRU_2_3]|nr:pirin family protein [Leptolyngbyaceae cyanobacterium CRU_2_3]